MRFRDGYSFRDVTPKEAVQHIEKPMLFIHSLPDDFIPAEMTEELFEAKLDQKMLALFEQGDHAQSFNESPLEYEQLIKDFLFNYGADEVFEEYDEEKDETTIGIYGEFTAFNNIQKFIEDNGYELVSAEFTRLPNVELKECTEEEKTTVDKLLEKLEEDEDVQNVYHTMKEE